MKTSLRAKALACALLTGTALSGLAAPAAAQTSPTFRNLDANGVDLARGDFLTSFPEGSIGSGEAELALLRILGATGTNGTLGSSQWDHIVLHVFPTGSYVDFGSRNDKFPGAESRGATLSGGGNSYQYRSPDGTVIGFGDPSPGGGSVSNFCDGTASPGCMLVPTSIASPDGKVVNINYDFWTLCIVTGGGGQVDDPDPEVIDCTHTPRIASVTNSYGYEIRFAYASPAGPGASSPPATFHQRTGASFYNVTASSAPLASVGYSYPSPGLTDITDQGGRVWQVTSGSANYAIRRPGASSNTTSASLTAGVVTSVTREGVTTNYSRTVSGGSSTATMTVTNALNQATTIVSDLTSGRPTSVTVTLASPTGPVDRTTEFRYDGSGRLTRTTAPEGNYVEHEYDARGNVTRTEAVPKGGSGPAIVTSALYDPTCANPVTCNQPISTTDARGNVTTYDYDPTHGGVTRVTSPAPTPNAVQPETRYSYTPVDGEYRLTGISQCRTASACAGTADEVKTALAYDSNGNLYWTASGSGDGALVAATTMTYDPIGNLETVDGPLPDTGDTVRIRYNEARQVVGTVSPDPDGPGPLKPLKHRAVRNSYDGSGLLTKVEQGNVDDQSDSKWAEFDPAQAVETVYDDNARPIVSKLTSGSTVHALTQTSYDPLGRPECSAQRMDPAAFGSLPASACSPSTTDTGANDYVPDRISKAIYDAAGRVVQVQTALGTTAAANEMTTTYTPNGQAETVTDGENNKTTYQYDGHDRLEKIYYPLPSPRGAGSSNGADYVQYGYDPNGNVTAFRNRANETFSFSYDALDRQTFKDLPGSEPDVTYAYDLLGRLTGASQTGHSIGFEWDALGRLKAQTNPIGTVTAEYDLAGRRTLLKWPAVPVFPSGYQVAYERLVTGEVTALREGAPLTGPLHAAFAYDDLGRRIALTRGNGASTGYGYGAASRLSSLTHDFAGTAQDLTLTFLYNPAGQIVSATRSNDAFVWTGHGSGTQASTPDGLNRVTDVGGSALNYDPKGNVVSLGARSFSYSSENLSLSEVLGSQSVTRRYDPLTRLSSTFTSGAVAPSEFLWFGEEMIGEYNNGTFALLYVHGPGVDEPLVSVYGNGNRYWFHADERGSVIAGSDPTGAAPYVNTYDEYGRGGGSRAFRFGFTGQIQLGPDRLYFKARMYDPGLGRFMQPDPIGYGDGMNMYAYVGGDPVNFTDPSGLKKDNEDEEKETIYVNGRLRGGAAAASLMGAFRTRGGNSPGDIGGISDCNNLGCIFTPDITVTGQQPNNKQPRLAQPASTLFRRAAKCTSDQLGISDIIAAGAVAAGQPIPGTKRFVTPGSSRGTSIAGMAADKAFGKARLPRSLPTIVGGPGTGRELAIASTKSLARFAGRAVPIVGWAWLAYDAVSIAVCTARSE